MSDSKINLYANYITKQLVREGVAINETGEKPDITDTVAKQAGISPEEQDKVLIHVASHGPHHTYAVGKEEGDDEPVEDVEHLTHDSSTGKTHSFRLPADKMSPHEVHKIMNKAIPGGVSREHAEAVTNGHNDHVDTIKRRSRNKDTAYPDQRFRRFRYL